MTAVAASESHTCAVTQDGQLHCFGRNGAGQCDVPEGLGPVTAVAARESHTCAVTRFWSESAQYTAEQEDFRDDAGPG